MERLYLTQDRYIAYNKYKSNKKNTFTVVFLHGLISSMNSTKSLYLDSYCRNRGYNYITFDNFGNGSSSGDFFQETIGSWVFGVESVLENLVEDQAILIGSSAGAWISLLTALKVPNKVKAVICLAAAVDFSHEIFWNVLSAKERRDFAKHKQMVIDQRDSGNKTYSISYDFLKEAKKHLLLNRPEMIDLKCPVHLIHGIKDSKISHNISMRLTQKISGPEVVLKLIKDGDHSLSREEDLHIITNSLEEIIALKFKR